MDKAPLKVAFIVPPKVHLLDITGPAHVFYEAKDEGAPLELIFSNIIKGQHEAESSSMLAFYKLVDFSGINLGKGDLVFIPGIESSLLLSREFLDACKPFQQWLREQYQRGAVLCSVCTGAFLLADAGLLDGKQCTSHWKYLDEIHKRYPKLKVLDNRLFVSDSDIYTSAGVTSGIDLALHILEKKLGSYFAAKIAKEVVVYHRRSEKDPQLDAFMLYRNHLDHRIHAVQDMLAQNLSDQTAIEVLAEKVCMSPRNLTRLFKKTTQITIGSYIAQLRISHAVKLLNEGYTLQAAADSCGLKSTAHLRRMIAKSSTAAMSG
ncbi:DJ-1/PfpI family protein [Mucilaginibacter sp. RS28]|uniref:DJ-1/PfpI family protein n=1 Tax=Mucilaginibacter straminoryzae TaxID=2932774 RepID=A0A9X1X372_9SPHI|nr:DJ-1/PfpI family protein [Mucilaginibacter straminoryzae]MCJ8210352.1 DJ-1/PfpI family protein [Mucilaginibacter straminoryzae]